LGHLGDWENLRHHHVGVLKIVHDFQNPNFLPLLNTLVLQSKALGVYINVDDKGVEVSLIGPINWVGDL
jgi:hypothetical protein